MSIELVWTLPVRGDGRSSLAGERTRGEFHAPGRARSDESVTDLRPGRFTSFDYLTQVARAAELAGFDTIVAPYDPAGEESWVVASALAREVRALRIITEFQPGFGTAVYAAKLSLSFQRFFADRLGWKPALSPDPPAQRAVGDFVDGRARIDRAEELLVVAQGVWNDAPFDHQGRWFEVERGGFFDPTPSAAVLGGQGIARRPFPTVYLDGSSDAELELSARFADVHVFDLVEPDELRDAIARHRALAHDWGRTVRYGVRVAVVASDAEHEARRRLARAWEHAVSDGGAGIEAHRSSGLRWHGFHQIGHAAPAGLVGSYAQVADQLAEYAALGVTTYSLDALPRLEEAYRLGENLVPRIRRLAAALPAGAGA